MHTHVGHRFQPQAGGRPKLGKPVHLPPSKEAFLHITDRIFHHALGLRMPRPARFYRKPVVPGKVQVLGIKHRVGPGHMREDGGLAVVHHHLARHPAEFFKGPPVTAQPPLLALPEGKFHMQEPAVTQNHDEKT